MENFEKNVFINCPFDENYKPLLKVLIFSTIKIGLNPRLALERNNSAEIRLSKIKEILEQSKYSIHDLSRAKSATKDEYSRLNMPFELGLDFGCKEYNPNPIFKHKKFLILEQERYSTQKALSDMAGADCKCHEGEAEELVNVVRNWFSDEFENLPSASKIWDEYNEFYGNLFADLTQKGFKSKEINNLPINEFLRYIKSSFN
ncbi:MAG TPA: hypothetical protein PLP39_07585 [Flavobacterium lutivivi]|nr:hypothetical protein [Flavobacterium lutivivi]